VCGFRQRVNLQQKAHPAVPGRLICSVRVPCAGDQRQLPSVGRQGVLERCFPARDEAVIDPEIGARSERSPSSRRCGVIPLVAGLLGAGVPLAPVMAFWISSPLMDPTQFFIASGVLGIGFASAKMLSAVGMGMLSGFGTMMLVRAGWLDAPATLRISAMAAGSCCGSKPAVTTPAPVKSCCGSAKAASDPSFAVPSSVVLWRFWTDGARAQRFLTTATWTGWFLVRWLAVAYAIESLMIAWLPVGAVGTWLGTGAGPLAVPLAVAIGIPVYLNSFAAIPFVSGLIGLGMSPGTGLAFMLATSATGFPAMVAVWALVKPQAFALYLGFAITGAMIAGYVYAATLALLSN
jgi:uncharacterized protein